MNGSRCFRLFFRILVIYFFLDYMRSATRSLQVYGAVKQPEVITSPKFPTILYMRTC